MAKQQQQITHSIYSERAQWQDLRHSLRTLVMSHATHSLYVSFDYMRAALYPDIFFLSIKLSALVKNHKIVCDDEMGHTIFFATRWI